DSPLARYILLHPDRGGDEHNRFPHRPSPLARFRQALPLPGKTGEITKGVSVQSCAAEPTLRSPCSSKGTRELPKVNIIRGSKHDRQTLFHYWPDCRTWRGCR